MLVFIDESGCAGFKVLKGSDSVFAVGMVIFETTQDADVTRATIRTLHQSLNHKSEFKFSKCSANVRDGFFSGIAGCPFSIRAVVVQKQDIYSHHLRGTPSAFYSYFVKQVMNFDGGALKNAKVRLDGSGGRTFRRALGEYLRRELSGKIKDFKMNDSAGDELIQLADMCIGAIARTYRQRPDAGRWHAMLKSKVANVWEFK